MAKSLLRSSLVVALMTMVSRVLGLLRDVLLARFFDTAITDAFFVALRIPNMLRRFFAEGSFASAFVPVFSAVKAEGDKQALLALFRATLGALMSVLVAITLLGVVFSGALVMLVAGGLVEKPAQFLLASNMLRIMFPYILLISLTAMAGGILNTYERFALPALTPVLLNVALIVACGYRAWIAPESEGMELAWAVLIGGVLQLGVQLPVLRRLGLLQYPSWSLKHEKVRQIGRLMLPTLFGSSVGQLSLLVNTFLASTMITGSISWLYYADRLVELPVALIGVAFGTVTLPKLSALYQAQEMTKFYLTFDWALRWGILLGSAAAVGLVILAPSIVLVLFYGGAFTQVDWHNTVRALQCLGLGVFALVMVKILVTAFYARQDTKTPFIAGVCAILINLLMALSSYRIFAHLGLAAASAVAACVNMGVLAYFHYRDGLTVKRSLLWFVLKIVVANAAMAQVLWYLQGDVWRLLEMGRVWQVGYVLGLVLVGVAVFSVVLYAQGLRYHQLKLRSE